MTKKERRNLVRFVFDSVAVLAVYAALHLLGSLPTILWGV